MAAKVADRTATSSSLTYASYVSERDLRALVESLSIISIIQHHVLLSKHTVSLLMLYVYSSPQKFIASSTLSFVTSS